MPTLPDPDHHAQQRAVEIVARGIAVLRDRDGVVLTDQQIEERARNIVQALIVTDLVSPPVDAFAALDAAEARLRALEASR
jgi:hypothetical protein